MLRVRLLKVRCCSYEAGRGETHPRSACTYRRLLSSYLIVRQPSIAQTTYSRALRDFARVAILGYECGLTEESFAHFLSQEKPLEMIEWKECLEMVCLVWIALLFSYNSAQRWSATDPVSKETLQRCQGFVQMIAFSYFEKGMAWVSLEKLRLEQMATEGRTESLGRVAEKARIVFTTFETVAPQFPSF